MAGSGSWVARKVVDPVRQALRQGLTPYQIGMSLVCGLVSGIFPVPGTTTAVGFGLIYVFKVNPVLVQAVGILATPLELALIPWFAGLGAALFGVDASAYSISAFLDTLEAGVVDALLAFRTMLLLAVVGWCLCAPVLLLAGSLLSGLVARALPQKEHDKVV